MEPLEEAVTKHQTEAGRVGGRSRSPAKQAAVRANLAKARAKRWPGREAGTQSNALGSGYTGGGNEQERVPQTSSEDGGSVCFGASGPGSSVGRVACPT